MKDYLKYLIEYVRSFVTKTNCSGLVIGVSGGIDSAIALALSKLAFPNNYQGIFMPLDSSKLDFECIQILLNEGYNIEKFDLTNVLKSEKNILEKHNLIITKKTEGNLKARIRMIQLFTISNICNQLVVGTSNKSEYYLGYFTKYGDGAADIFPFIHLSKNKIFELGRLLKISQKIISREPSASLWKDQTDEKELGFSYENLESFFNNKKLNQAVERRIKNLHQNSKHKRVIDFPNEP